MRLNTILTDIASERQRQTEKWGEQTHPFTNIPTSAHVHLADSWKTINDQRAKGEGGELAWDTIALEELHEAFAETNLLKIRSEAIQTAAVMVAMIEQIDRQMKEGSL